MKHEAVVWLLCFNELIEPRWLLVDSGSPHWFVGREENRCYMSFVAKLPARWLAKWSQYWGPIDLVPHQKFTVCHGPFNSITFMAIFDRKFITREGTHFSSRFQKISNSKIFQVSENIKLWNFPGFRKHQSNSKIFHHSNNDSNTYIWDAFCTASCDSDFSGLYRRLGGRGPKDDHTTGLAHLHFGFPWQQWQH